MMKKLITLVVIVVIVLIGLRMFGIKTSVRLNTGSDEPEGLLSAYDVGKIESKYTSIVGGEVPKAAKDIDGYTLQTGFSGLCPVRSWLTASLPKKDFMRLVEWESATHKPDLLQLHPGALDCEAEEFARNWDVTPVVNRDTYYAEEPVEKTYRVFKYENGKMYVKKVTFYLEVKVQKRGRNYGMYKKAFRKNPKK